MVVPDAQHSPAYLWKYDSHSAWGFATQQVDLSWLWWVAPCTAESFRLTRTRLFPPFPCFPKNSPTLPFWLTSLCVAPYSHLLFIHLLRAYDPVRPTILCLPMLNCSHTSSLHFMSFSISVAHDPILSARIISHSDARDPFHLSLQQRCQCLPCIPGLINLSPH